VGELELEISPELAGERLDAVLAPRLGSRTRAQRLIEAGRVTVDGESRSKRHRVAAGERIVAALEPEPDIDPGEVPLDVVFEDEHLLVVDKPAGVVVHPAAGHRGPTLADGLRGRAAGGLDPERPGIVHRLDRDTSGLMVVAKSDAAHAALQDLLRRRELEREYIALVEGRPDARTGTIDAPIGRDRRNRSVMSTHTDVPRAAVTHFEQLEALRDATLVKVRLETGRTHQIRAHFAAIGHPVVGDPAYGGRRSGRQLGLTRQFLHSAAIRFRHPITGQPIALKSDLPADLRRALDSARRG
jgi:23S rRNA pseudouridine1911/1915/1917 synthase